MPPQVNGQDEHGNAAPPAQDPWPAPDENPVESDEKQPVPLGHDDLIALRSSRHVARRPRRRRRWPWVALFVLLLVAGGAYAFYLYGMPYVEDFLVEREIERAVAGYSGLVTDYEDGTATISGSVPTQADVDRLLTSVGEIEEVAEVVADLSITAQTADPIEIAVLQALESAGLTTVTPIIEGSRVTLTGSVPTESAIDEASALVVDVAGVSQVLNRLVVGSDVAAAAQQAVQAAGFSSVSVNVNGNVAVLSGTVASDDDVLTAADLVLGVSGIDKVDNRLVVGDDISVPPPNVPIGEVDGAVSAALAEAGFENVFVSFDGSVAYLDGVVPFEILEDGYFSYVDDIRDIVQSVGGAETMVNRLRLRGNEIELRAQLQALLDEQPVVFLSGSSDLTIESQDVLDRAAGIILSQPGLTVFIAGHTDASGSAESNEQLARARGAAVYGYLVSAGVPANRMAVVSYGELFPGEGASAADDRRIEFEVGP
jgi:OOP family OmpA-OmpF porin